jgi:hypothetical protein
LTAKDNGNCAHNYDRHKFVFFIYYLSLQNPAFGPIQIRALTEVFTEKAIQVKLGVDHHHDSIIQTKLPQLRDIWSSEIAKPDFKGRIDVLGWLSKLTLEVIGQAGAYIWFGA